MVCNVALCTAGSYTSHALLANSLAYTLLVTWFRLHGPMSDVTHCTIITYPALSLTP